MPDSIKLSPSFKASLNYSKITNNVDKWADVSTKFKKTTQDFSKYEVKLNDDTNSMIIKKINPDATKKALIKATFRKEGGLQSLLDKGLDRAVDYLKKFLEKNVEKYDKDEQAYKFAEKLEKKIKKKNGEHLNYFPDDVFGGF